LEYDVIIKHFIA